MPYCILGWDGEHDGENCSLSETANSQVDIELSKPLGILPQVPRTPKEDKLVSDVKSTGRKRAVQVKPILPGMKCEWLGLKNSGGGLHPIVGCLDNDATNVHHGPDKNTLNNKPSNLHAICATCHNRWHTRNDGTYPEENIGETWVPIGEYSPHDPTTRFTPEEFLASEVYWNTPVAERKEPCQKVSLKKLSLKN